MTTAPAPSPAVTPLGERYDPAAPDADPTAELRSATGISAAETFAIALSSLTANKLRTLLTALGIIIGVAAVVALMAIGQGSQQSITETITANGANLLTVRSGASSSGGVRGAVGSSQTLTTDDAEALADTANVPDASLVSPEYSSFSQLVAGSQNTNAQVTGATPVYQTVHNIAVESGSFFSEDELSSRANVVVLGAGVAETLFPDGDALGQTVRISGQRFTVIGVLAAKGGGGFGSTDDGVLVPLSTAQDELFGSKKLSSIAIQAADESSVDAALAEIQQTLRTQHELAADGSADDFSVINQQDQLESVQSATQTMTLFLAAIAAISLVVGGIGIMNIMLVSVRERTREIGLRKAIGAREGDILTQFMLEALTISLLGALIGLILGVSIALVVDLIGLMTATLSVGAGALAVGVALAIGLFFGIAPARSAARLDPMVALRAE